jgi:hypothetical protein
MERVYAHLSKNGCRKSGLLADPELTVTLLYVFQNIPCQPVTPAVSQDTTESDKSASYLDILLNIDSNGRLTTSLYDKRNDFDFEIVNFPFLCSNIPLSPAYGVDLIRKSMFYV